MNKGKGFIGCTRCYKKKVDCKCIISDFHVIQSRAFYYWKFIENYPELKEKELGLEEKELSGVKGCGKFIREELKWDTIEGYICGQYYDSIKKVILCPECQENEDTEEEIQLTDFGNRIADKLIKEKEKELAGGEE